MNWSRRFGFGFPPSDSKGRNPFIKLVWFMSSCAPNCILPSTEHLVFIVIVIVVSIGWAHRIWKFWFQTRFRSLVVFAILCWSILIVTYVDLPPADKHCRNFFASIFLAVIASARWSFLPLHISL